MMKMTITEKLILLAEMERRNAERIRNHTEGK